MKIAYTIHDIIPTDAAAIVDTGLGDSNSAAARLEDVQPIACFAHSDTGAVLGGAIGRTWGSCCELLQLWVSPSQRRQGIGARLVKDFEQHAIKRGCTTFYLETFSFQAPLLYRSLGYEVKVELKGYGPGIEKYTMVRTIDPQPTLLDRFYAALKALSTTDLAACVTDDFVLDWQGSTAIPWAGQWHGVDGLLNFVAKLNQHLEILNVQRLHQLEQGDVTVVVLKGHWRIKKSGAEIQAKAANLFTFSNNRIQSYTVMNNTAAFADALETC
jgi:ribosomal protein S18 acetylase RimI-like enzyme/ketosteroid isomerase-like protein